MTRHKKLKLDDLVETAINFAGGYVLGALSSYFYPFAVPQAIQGIRNGGAKSLAGFAAYSGGLIGYSNGISKIIERIVEEPQNPISYIPIATNLIGSAIFLKLASDEKNNLLVETKN